MDPPFFSNAYLARKHPTVCVVAVGRAWILFGSRKNSKPEKCSKMPQNPHRPLHALLARLLGLGRRKLIRMLVLSAIFLFSAPRYASLRLLELMNPGVCTKIFDALMRLKKLYGKYRQWFPFSIRGEILQMDGK
jgi:hypothetical protein